MTTEPHTSPGDAQPMSIPSWPDQIREVLADEAGVHDGPGHATHVAPLVAFHHWQAGVVADLISEAVARHGGDPSPHDALRAAHEQAAAGQPVGEDVWSALLEPALRDVYRLAYPREQVHTRASTAAASFARSHGWSNEEAEQYGTSYARMNTEAAERVHSEANAIANAAAYAAAFAAGDADGCARAWPFALVQAWIAAASGAAGTDGAEAAAIRTRLRDGFAEACARTVT
ncbi:SpcZ [Streptomyces sp. NPDC093228]|uniref:SpcZ n=1 Tax=Streptomyces sp. NPDC093228 TaxID=3155070 RepID=UPI0034219A93